MGTVAKNRAGSETQRLAAGWGALVEGAAPLQPGGQVHGEGEPVPAPDAGVLRGMPGLRGDPLRQASARRPHPSPFFFPRKGSLGRGANGGIFANVFVLSFWLGVDSSSSKNTAGGIIMPPPHGLGHDLFMGGQDGGCRPRRSCSGTGWSSPTPPDAPPCGAAPPPPPRRGLDTTINFCSSRSVLARPPKLSLAPKTHTAT